MTQEQQPPKTSRASRAARDGMPQPPSANFHALPCMQIPPELATVLYYSRNPQCVPAGANIPAHHIHAANMFASAAYQNLSRNPEQYTREPPAPGYRVPPVLVPGGLAPRPYDAANTETEAGLPNGVISDAVTGAVTTNDTDNNGGGNAATHSPTTIIGEQPAAAVANDTNNNIDIAAAAVSGDDDIFNTGDYAQPSAASPIELRINTGVTVSRSDNVVVVQTNPADVAGAVASAVMTAIEQASSGGIGIPMIDESGAPRPLRVHVDAAIHVGGSGNVLGPEALVRDCLQATAMVSSRASQVLRNLKRGREEDDDDNDEEVVVRGGDDDDDGESVASKRSRSA